MKALLISGPMDGEFVTNYAIYDDPSAGLVELVLLPGGEVFANHDSDYESLEDAKESNDTMSRQVEEVDIETKQDLIARMGERVSF